MNVICIPTKKMSSSPETKALNLLRVQKCFYSPLQHVKIQTNMTEGNLSALIVCLMYGDLAVFFLSYLLEKYCLRQKNILNSTLDLLKIANNFSCKRS